MIVIIILLTSLYRAQSACLTYWAYSESFAFWCDDEPHTIKFLTEFCVPPQILITSVFYYRSGTPTFSFKILTITTKSFQVQSQCDPSFSQSFTFVALIDNQLFVVNDFMSSITLIDGYRTALIPYPMQNTDYEIIYSITSYSGGSPNIVVEKQATGFNLYITGVDSTQLSGLGVQLIVGLKSLSKLFSTLSITCPDISMQFPNTTPLQTFLPTEIPIFSLQNNHGFVQRITAEYNYQRMLIYTDSVCHYDKPVNFKLYIYDFKYQPHYYKKIRVGHVMSLDHRIMLSFITQKLQFIEIGKTWSDIDTVSIPMMQYNEPRISLVYSHACQPDRKITVTILRQGDQGVYNYIYTQYCHRLYNLITMYIQLLSQRSTTSELQFSLTASGVQIQEKMLDTGNTFQLLKIEYQ